MRSAACGAACALSLAACTGGVGSTDTSSRIVTYTVSGSVSGLAGAGLVLQNNGTDNLAVKADGSFTFSSALVPGDRYQVSVWAQPTGPSQTCTVGQGGGIVGQGDVTGITVLCADKTTATDTIGGIAIGVVGSGLTLQDNGGDALAVSAGGTFTFATGLAPGAGYNVTVASPPVNPYQDCVVQNGSGIAGAVDVTNIEVSCEANSNPQYTVSVTVTGISASAPLTVENNGRDRMTLSANGTYAFPTKIPSGSAYEVTLVPLTEQQSQTCQFSNASGTVAGAPVDVMVACQSNVAISGTVSGLATADEVILQDNGGDTLAVSANGPFTFPTALASGGTYQVTVLQQPTLPPEICTVSNGSGIAPPSSAAPITVACVAAYTVGGTVSGLPGAEGPPVSVVLENDGGENLPVSANGPFAFPPQASGSAYEVTVLTAPTGYVCDVAGGSGTVTANVTAVTVACAPIGGFLYVTNAADNSLSSYAINSSTGSLHLLAATTPTGTAPSGVGAQCGSQLQVSATVYVANQGSNTLSGYGENTTTGVLNLLPSDPASGALNPVATAGTPSGVATALINGTTGCAVYTANTGADSISAYSENAATGILTSAGAAASGAQPTGIALTGYDSFIVDNYPGPSFFLFSANKGGTVSAFSVDQTTAALTAVGTVPAGGSSPVAISTGTVPVTVQGVATTEPIVYVVNQGSNDVSGFNVAMPPADEANGIANGTLTPLADSPYAAGSGPNAIAVVGEYVYVANGTDATVTVYSINTAVGTPVSLGGLVPMPGLTVSTGKDPVAITFGDGFLYAVNAQSDSVSVYLLNGDTGALTEVPGSPFPSGKSPSSVAYQPP